MNAFIFDPEGGLEVATWGLKITTWGLTIATWGLRIFIWHLILRTDLQGHRTCINILAIATCTILTTLLRDSSVLTSGSSSRGCKCLRVSEVKGDPYYWQGQKWVYPPPPNPLKAKGDMLTIESSYNVIQWLNIARLCFNRESMRGRDYFDVNLGSRFGDALALIGMR